MSRITLSGGFLSTPLLRWFIRAAALFCGIASGTASEAENKLRVESSIRKIPFHFEPQADGKFVSRGLGYSLQLGSWEVALRLDGFEGQARSDFLNGAVEIHEGQPEPADGSNRSAAGSE